MRAGVPPATGIVLEAAFAVEDEGGAVARPVGSLEALGRDVDDAAIGGVDGDGFESAVELRLGGGGGERS